MYLKKITIKGFKSFADKTIFDLDKGITGIVGPNGSGKSNVVDAVRWVLGEQSTKSLRANDSMTDVIFAGSKSREKSNQAYVAITFDNSDKFMNLDYNEIEVKRQVYIDGTNEYYINNEKVRLKDITEFLIDSGIGKESFNIISQGKIEDILSSKPENRRLVFEDAAGVLKYKKRKEEANKKLERTSNNIDRINDIINELEVQVEPLKEEARKLEEYNKLTEELKDVEIALVASDITKYNDEYKSLKEKVDILNREILNLETEKNKGEAININNKLELEKYDNLINELNKNLIELTSKVEQLNTKRLMIIERAKYEVSDTKMHSILLEQKEKEISLKNNIEILKNSINELKEQKEKLILNKNNLLKEENDLLNKRNEYDKKLQGLIYVKEKMDVQIDSLNDRIINNDSMPYGVKAVINNPKLSGIEGTIGNLIEINKGYEEAISTALGGSISYVITENEEYAKEGINYLKENKLGRVTFFPLNIIKSKYLSININLKGYLGIASDFVKTNEKYKNVIENQLGNILVVDNLDNASKIAKELNYQYRIVTITGEIIHSGGSLTGGVNKSHNIINDKLELDKLIEKRDELINNIRKHENEINEIDYNISNLDSKKENNKIFELEENINIKNKSLDSLNKDLLNVQNEIEDLNNKLGNNLSKIEEEITIEYNNLLKDKELLENKLNKTKEERNSLYTDLNSLEFVNKKITSEITNKTKEQNEYNLSITKLDGKLDNLLNNLSENYSITYERAKEYRLEYDEAKSRSMVNSLKRQIKDLGTISMGSNELYNQVSERYEFLLKQREDLVKAENMLLEVIEEMDKQMANDFVKTFESIRANFKIVFRELFRGGEADLKLTNPDDILNTGIDIIAYPPGKKLGKTVFLSGGEKTFTAISILFAILKTKKIPFCIFDEVEAALDEANVVSFGEYVKNLKNETQFIIITHKKKTMEFADSLYGITMQESGVSKLVSVKLKV